MFGGSDWVSPNLDTTIWASTYRTVKKWTIKVAIKLFSWLLAMPIAVPNHLSIRWFYWIGQISNRKSCLGHLEKLQIVATGWTSDRGYVFRQGYRSLYRQKHKDHVSSRWLRYNKKRLVLKEINPHFYVHILKIIHLNLPVWGKKLFDIWTFTLWAHVWFIWMKKSFNELIKSLMRCLRSCEMARFSAFAPSRKIVFRL